MDLFKKYNANEYTASDLNSKCVIIKHKNRRTLKKLSNKVARKRIKILTENEVKDFL